MGCCDFAKSLQSDVFLLLLAVIWALELVFLDVLENVLEFDTVYFAGLGVNHWVVVSYLSDCALLICQSQLLFSQFFDHRILPRNDKLICLDGISLWKVHDFSFQAVDCESLGRGDLQYSFNVYDNFVEIGVFLLKLLESLFS